MYKLRRTSAINSNFNTEVTSSAFTCMSKCMVLGSAIWKLHAKQRDLKRSILKMKVKDIYDWLQFDGLTSHAILQTNAKMTFLSPANMKKLQNVCSWKWKNIGDLIEYMYTNFVYQRFISLQEILLLGPVVCSWCISWRADVYRRSLILLHEIKPLNSVYGVQTDTRSLRLGTKFPTSWIPSYSLQPKVTRCKYPRLLFNCGILLQSSDLNNIIKPFTRTRLQQCGIFCFLPFWLGRD